MMHHVSLLLLPCGEQKEFCHKKCAQRVGGDWSCGAVYASATSPGGLQFCGVGGSGTRMI